MIKPKKTRKIQHLQKNNIIRVPLTPAFKKFFKEMAPLKNHLVISNLLNRHKSLESKPFYNVGTECQHSKINVQFQKLMRMNTDPYWFIILEISKHLNKMLKSLNLPLEKETSKPFYLTEKNFLFKFFKIVHVYL